MSKSKLMKMPVEFDNYLNDELKRLIEDCKLLGIHIKRIPKTKATKLLTKRILENGKINLKLI